jgi:carbon-monoxide dehydrogenase small subunit
MTAIGLTINGTSVTLDVDPRHTLADTLRTRAGLTGVHLGCEHGVCGMCTVLIDGKAMRSCLIFTAQLDGAEITTIEALGKPDDLHPLQQAFHTHHALQCGFCTPAFLLSTYELLRDNPGLDGVDLPAELSGVLCRCTGYQGILDAVRDTASRYPHGVPPPGNVGENRALAVRLGQASGPAVPAAAAAATADAGTTGDPAPPSPGEVEVPTGEPSATVDVTTGLAVTADAVWALLTDIPRTARCIPGAELDQQVSDDTYTGHIQIAAGPLRFRFAGTVRVIDTDHQDRTLHLAATGKDTGGSTARADLHLHVEPTATGSTIRANAKLFLAGRIARFGRSLAGDISRGLFEQFGDNVQATLTGGETASTTSTEPQPLRIGPLLRSTLATLLDRARKRYHELRTPPGGGSGQR